MKLIFRSMRKYRGSIAIAVFLIWLVMTIVRKQEEKKRK